MFDQLTEALVEMKENEALAQARELLDAGQDPVEILNACTRAMEQVGDRFEKGEYYLPQLMMAGEMLRQISEMVKPRLEGQITQAKKKGRVLMGTVQGDIHDIGKDIVTFILEVNGFEVRDLGIDVPPQRFVEAVREFQPQVVGLSGLLTLAYDSMRATVQAISEAGLRDGVKVMIGGGQMTKEVQEHVGADAIGKNAIEGLNLAKRWILAE